MNDRDMKNIEILPSGNYRVCVQHQGEKLTGVAGAGEARCVARGRDLGIPIRIGEEVKLYIRDRTRERMSIAEDGGAVRIAREDLVGGDWTVDPEAGLTFGSEYLSEVIRALAMFLPAPTASASKEKDLETSADHAPTRARAPDGDDGTMPDRATRTDTSTRHSPPAEAPESRGATWDGSPQKAKLDAKVAEIVERGTAHLASLGAQRASDACPHTKTTSKQSPASRSERCLNCGAIRKLVGDPFDGNPLEWTAWTRTNEPRPELDFKRACKIVDAARARQNAGGEALDVAHRVFDEIRAEYQTNEECPVWCSIDQKCARCRGEEQRPPEASPEDWVKAFLDRRLDPQTPLRGLCEDIAITAYRAGRGSCSDKPLPHPGDLGLLEETANGGHHPDCDCDRQRCTCAVHVAEAALRLLGTRTETAVAPEPTSDIPSLKAAVNEAKKVLSDYVNFKVLQQRCAGQKIELHTLDRKIRDLKKLIAEACNRFCGQRGPGEQVCPCCEALHNIFMPGPADEQPDEKGEGSEK